MAILGDGVSEGGGIIKTVHVSYLNSSTKLIKKLPIGNTFLKSLSVLGPSIDRDPVNFEVFID